MTNGHEARSRTDDLPVEVMHTMPIQVSGIPEPTMHPFTERLWRALPQTYRIMDERQDWILKRLLAGLSSEASKIDDVLAELWGARPIGPARPTPWTRGMSEEELARWRRQRRSRSSTLGDPSLARPEWLAWLAQHVGVTLDLDATIAEQRDMVRYGTSGWKAGTPASIANAARSALTGSRFSRVVRGWRPDVRETGAQSTMWDLTVITRTSETPNPAELLSVIARKGCKPAGVVLHHRAFEAPWKVIEALRPTWTDWERTRSADNTFHSTTWTELEETGLSFADVPGQMWRNASFENGVAFWVASGGAIEPVVGGIDGFGAARLTAVGSVSAAYDRVNLITRPTLDAVEIEPVGYRFGRGRTGVVVGQIDTADTIVPAQGSRYGRFVLTSSAGGGPTVADQAVQVDPEPVTPNVPYVFAFSANSSGGETGYAHVGVEWLDANGVILETVNGLSGTNVQLNRADQWKSIELTATSPAGAAQARMVLWFTSTEPGVSRTMRFDAVHAEREDTYDGTFIVGQVRVPAQTPGIDITQDLVRATFHEDYRAALNVFGIETPCSVRIRAQFFDDAGTLLDTQTQNLGSSNLGVWRRTRSAHFRTNEFATTQRVTMQFRDMQPGQIVDIDACELRPYQGGV